MTMATSGQLEQLHGEFRISPDGILLCRGATAALLSALGTYFRHAAMGAGAEQHWFPTVIAERRLRRAGYFESFAARAPRLHDPAPRGGYFLSPVVCYHCYELLVDSEFERPAVLTCFAIPIPRALRARRTSKSAQLPWPVFPAV
jgi:seryl-tRNA synthetase